ncbi:potassium channel family protein [Lentilactobacillus sp. Marseille-Q4993]|uniref:potassium channel family protein n=1 Tax=Lentilactobacillus sp. Marseille-Q4993 TaxID=3039492 RepID=UPI0024BD2BB8|nr:potassium channel family protein [Lentilactobacillus sp. Marseille-Q4993]
MNEKQKTGILLFYNVLIAGLALISIGMVVLALLGDISLHIGWARTTFYVIWLVFLGDYLVRFFRAKSRKQFLIENMFDLIALVPSHPIFVFFRFARIVRIIRYYHIFWKLGWSGKFTKNMHNFLYDTGFIYLLSISLVILIFSSLIFASFEHDSLAKSLWWAITTATTVGYGDVTPHTMGGKVVSGILMFGGIGFIGLLTSTITDFFTDQNAEDEKEASIKELTRQVTRLTKQVNHLERTIAKQNNKK